HSYLAFYVTLEKTRNAPKRYVDKTNSMISITSRYNVYNENVDILNLLFYTSMDKITSFLQLYNSPPFKNHTEPMINTKMCSFNPGM
ncbi:hypothetical protein PFDG_05006, partial [Plasmodium falciparum Dd2]